MTMTRNTAEQRDCGTLKCEQEKSEKNIIITLKNVIIMHFTATIAPPTFSDNVGAGHLMGEISLWGRVPQIVCNTILTSVFSVANLAILPPATFTTH